MTFGGRPEESFRRTLWEGGLLSFKTSIILARAKRLGVRRLDAAVVAGCTHQDRIPIQLKLIPIPRRRRAAALQGASRTQLARGAYLPTMAPAIRTGLAQAI